MTTTANSCARDGYIASIGYPSMLEIFLSSSMPVSFRRTRRCLWCMWNSLAISPNLLNCYGLRCARRRLLCLGRIGTSAALVDSACCAVIAHCQTCSNIFERACFIEGRCKKCRECDVWHDADSCSASSKAITERSCRKCWDRSEKECFACKDCAG